MMPLRVYLEVGPKWTFASALDWPGWSRRDRGRDAAIEALLGYRERYSLVVAGSFDFRPGPVEVLGEVQGGTGTDFGAPSEPWPGDSDPLPAAEAERQASIVEACWRTFDTVQQSAPRQLRKGPRGGGRDTDRMVEHVREAERSYASKTGIRVPPRTAWPDQRAALLAALRAGAPAGRWPARYAARRIAWHVLDHAWEIEDKS